MYGMINRSIESFLRFTYGDSCWQDVVRMARVPHPGFFATAGSHDKLTRKVIYAAAHQLKKSPGEVLEDWGAWLVQLESVRRLLRFSGPNFVEFVLSLEELPGRARLILPELPVPELTVTPDETEFRIGSDRLPPGWIWALAGALRGMADDYGTLALIAVSGNWITLRIALEEHAISRPFELSPHQAGLMP